MAEKSPCYKCSERTEFCHQSCKKWLIWKIKAYLQYKQIRKYNEEHSHCMTEGERKRAIKNLEWKTSKKRK